MSAICARRFMASPFFSAFLLPVHAVHQHRGRTDVVRLRRRREAGADAPVELLKCVCTSFLG
jgi:hypothetical protein